MRPAAARFELPGDARGVLCVHGFTGTPYEMRYLGESLHRRGYTVVGPVLPGHGTTVADLARTTWRDWAAAVERELAALARRCRQVAVVGQSLGGLLALHQAHAGATAPAAVVSLAAPLWLPPLGRAVAALARAVPALPRLVPSLPKAGGSDVRAAEARRDNPAYPALPLAALAELDDFTRVVRAGLPAVRAPVLIIHARHDHTAPFASSLALACELGAAHVRHLTLARSYHLIALDVERDQVATATGRFLDTQLGAATRAAG